MYNVKDFIKWALTHVNPYTVPTTAKLARPWNECGGEPWQYLFGSVRVKTTQATLDRYFTNHYGNPKEYYPPMSRAKFDAITANWDRNGYATDCQGLCDAYLTYECGEKTDINADMNYRLWCTDKGRIEDVNRGWKIGEAVFTQSTKTGKMTHIGWICGFDDGEPLVVEARGITYGVVVTRLWDRNFTHRGLMTIKFEYPEDEPVKFEVTKPMRQGEPYLAMQKALNLAGYTDDEGKPLEEDGKWGKRSQQAFNKMILDYMPEPEVKHCTVTITGDAEIPVFEGEFNL